MKEIRLVTMLNGDVVLNKSAKDGVSLKKICDIAENEVTDGYADFATVLVDSDVYRVFKKEMYEGL